MVTTAFGVMSVLSRPLLQREAPHFVPRLLRLVAAAAALSVQDRQRWRRLSMRMVGELVDKLGQAMARWYRPAADLLAVPLPRNASSGELREALRAHLGLVTAAAPALAPSDVVSMVSSAPGGWPARFVGAMETDDPSVASLVLDTLRAVLMPASGGAGVRPGARSRCLEAVLASLNTCLGSISNLPLARVLLLMAAVQGLASHPSTDAPTLVRLWEFAVARLSLSRRSILSSAQLRLASLLTISTIFVCATRRTGPACRAITRHPTHGPAWLAASVAALLASDAGARLADPLAEAALTLVCHLVDTICRDDDDGGGADSAAAAVATQTPDHADHDRRVDEAVAQLLDALVAFTRRRGTGQSGAVSPSLTSDSRLAIVSADLSVDLVVRRKDLAPSHVFNVLGAVVDVFVAPVPADGTHPKIRVCANDFLARLAPVAIAHAHTPEAASVLVYRHHDLRLGLLGGSVSEAGTSVPNGDLLNRFEVAPSDLVAWIEYTAQVNPKTRSSLKRSEAGMETWLARVTAAVLRGDPTAAANLRAQAAAIAPAELMTAACAKLCVDRRLRTPYGGPMATFERLEGHLMSALQHPRPDPRRLGLLLAFFEALEKRLFNVARGSWTHRLAPASDKFFKTNAKVCRDWYARFRPRLLALAAAIGAAPFVVRFGLLRLEELRALLLALPNPSDRAAVAADVEETLVVLGEALVGTREGSTLDGLRSWVDRLNADLAGTAHINGAYLRGVALMASSRLSAAAATLAASLEQSAAASLAAGLTGGVGETGGKAARADAAPSNGSNNGGKGSKRKPKKDKKGKKDKQGKPPGKGQSSQQSPPVAAVPGVLSPLAANHVASLVTECFVGLGDGDGLQKWITTLQDVRRQAIEPPSALAASLKRLGAMQLRALAHYDMGELDRASHFGDLVGDDQGQLDGKAAVVPSVSAIRVADRYAMLATLLRVYEDGVDAHRRHGSSEQLGAAGGVSGVTGMDRSNVVGSISDGGDGLESSSEFETSGGSIRGGVRRPAAGPSPAVTVLSGAAVESLRASLAGGALSTAADAMELAALDGVRNASGAGLATLMTALDRLHTTACLAGMIRSGEPDPRLGDVWGRDTEAAIAHTHDPQEVADVLRVGLLRSWLLREDLRRASDPSVPSGPSLQPLAFRAAQIAQAEGNHQLAFRLLRGCDKTLVPVALARVRISVATGTVQVAEGIRLLWRLAAGLADAGPDRAIVDGAGSGGLVGADAADLHGAKVFSTLSKWVQSDPDGLQGARGCACVCA